MRILLAGLILVESLALELLRSRDPAGPMQFLVQYGDVIVIPFALAMLVGWKTRGAVILTWLFYSFRIRAGLLGPEAGVDVGDYVLTLAVFWSMFLPMGRHLSLDSLRDSKPPAQFLSVAGGALLFQLFIIYFSAGVTKSMQEWVIDASAMETVLANPAFETSFGLWLVGFPSLLAVASIATVLIEVVGSLLVILPGESVHRRRLIVVPVFIAFHVGIAATMGIGLFPYVCMVVWLVFLPPMFWDRFPGFPSGSSRSTESLIDGNRWRNTFAGMAAAIAAVSNLITWLDGTKPGGLAEVWQIVAMYLVLYQQWAMFSAPSGLG